jgi:hypothetical protein
MSQSRFVYVIFIRAAPERLWSALIDPDFVEWDWFGMYQKSDRKAGSPWQLLFPLVGDAGDAPKLTVIHVPDRAEPNLSKLFQWVGVYLPTSSRSLKQAI